MSDLHTEDAPASLLLRALSGIADDCASESLLLEDAVTKVLDRFPTLEDISIKELQRVDKIIQTLNDLSAVLAKTGTLITAESGVDAIDIHEIAHTARLEDNRTKIRKSLGRRAEIGAAPKEQGPETTQDDVELF